MFFILFSVGKQNNASYPTASNEWDTAWLKKSLFYANKLIIVCFLWGLFLLFTQNKIWAQHTFEHWI